ncbi:MAG: hypothetical protein EOO63_11295 [Hymenobacter sp.]|nr:MAG: hypothetical protein EOO63_11295 [Hymenobacter sp.]
MKALLLILAIGAATAAQAQTVSVNPSAQLRGGAQNQTVVPPLNPALNQSTIQGPAEVQRTLSSYDAQPSRLPVGGVPIGGTPELSPSSQPDVREQPLMPQQRRWQSSDVVPTRSRVSGSNNAQQTYRRPVQAPLSPAAQY